MCTSVFLQFSHSYFGRNLDLAYPLQCESIYIPSKFILNFKFENAIKQHYQILGVGTVINETPLLFEGINDQGLGVASLNFPRNAVFNKPQNGKINLAPYEIITYFLSLYKSLDDIKKDIDKLNITDIRFLDNLPLAPLHYLIADKSGAIVVEQSKEGLKIYDNPYQILTNNPPFSYHLENVNNYMGLSSKQIENRFSPDLNLIPHSLGMGSLSLPGDASSPSRFIRAFFYKYHQDKKTSIDEERKAYFDLLAKVKVLKGEAYDGDNPEYTVYSSCYDIDDFSLFYITYDSNVYQKFTYEKTDDALVHNPLKNQILFALGK